MERLCQYMVRTGIADSEEKAAALLSLNCMMKTRGYQMRITMSLPNCSWNVDHVIRDTNAVPNVIRSDATFESRRSLINQMQP